MKYFIFLIVSETETIIQEVHNHNTLESIIQFMESHFGSNNFFIYESDSWTDKFYQIVKGKIKKFGKYDFLYENPGLLYLYENYNILFSNPEIFNVISEHNLNLILSDYKQLLYNYGFKEVTINNWKYKLTVTSMFITFGIDPTPTKKYVNWLNKLNYIHGILSEDEEKIKNILIDFDKPEVKSLIKKAGYNLDINLYKDDKELFDVIDEVYYSKLSELELNDTVKLIEARTIFEDDNWLVVVPENHNESVKISRYGGMTYWCTAADSKESEHHYNNYTENGKKRLFIFINKHNNSEKYQWSEKTEDFLDKNDEIFDIDIFDPEFIKNFYISNKNIPNKFIYILIQNNEFLDDFIKSENEYVRKKVAEQGYGLDILVHDKNLYVRKKVAEQGYGLDILVHDENVDIRQEVAKKGYGLDILVHDEFVSVRYEVAKQGYGLDILIHDEFVSVRYEVAKQGYGLDILVHDEFASVRLAVAEQGYGLDILVHDKDLYVKKKVAKQGYGLDILIHDEFASVRYEVAKQGYGLDILIHDEFASVRMGVAEQGYGLDILVHDKDKDVRKTALSMLK